MFSKIILFITAFICSGILYAQEEENLRTEKEESLKNCHRVTLSISHSHIREGLKNENGLTGITLASWALDYDYWLSDHWAIGLHSDMLLENFSVVARRNDKEEEEVLERSYPVASVPVVLFKPWKHLLFLGGVGGEFAKGENFMVYRMGTEFSWPVHKSWEIGLSATYDIKKDSYDTWLIGFGVSKLFHRKKS